MLPPELLNEERQLKRLESKINPGSRQNQNNDDGIYQHQLTE